jgi:putative Mg2+ transporter-C (MgtC) family protein
MIWATAAMGMGIGAGYESVSVLACLLILAMLFAFSRLEGWIDRISQTRDYKIVCQFHQHTLLNYEKSFKEYHLKFKRSREIKENDLITGEWIVRGSEKNHRLFADAILKDPEVKIFEF